MTKKSKNAELQEVLRELVYSHRVRLGQLVGDESEEVQQKRKILSAEQNLAQSIYEFMRGGELPLRSYLLKKEK